MGYPIELEELPDEKLREELLRRDKLRMKNKCAYCKRDKGAEPACKMTEEHATLAVAPGPSGRATKREELEAAKQRVYEQLCAVYKTHVDTDPATLLWYVVEGAAAYWADNPADFIIQAAEGGKAVVFGGYNRITWTPAGGYQIHRYSCSDAFITRYLSIGPNPAGYVE